MSAPRRSFLKTSAAAGTAAALTAAAAPAAKLRAAHAEEIKVGVIGCGGRGCGAVGDAITAAREAETAPVKLVAAADLFEDTFRDPKYKALAGQFPDQAAVPNEMQFAGFDAYKQVLAQDLDYVIIATPPGFRPIHFEAAVEKGCDIFCEKPIATDAPGVRRFLKAVEASKAKNLKVGVGLQRHHQSYYLELAEKIAGGAIGEIVSMLVYWNSGGVWDPRVTREQVSSELEYQLRNWYYYTWICGDQIVEQHIHNLDVGNWWAGIKASGDAAGPPVFPVLCRGMGGRQVRTDPKYGEIYDHTACQYEYADGTVMISEGRHQPGVWNSVSEVAHGTEGMVSTEGNQASIYSERNWNAETQKFDRAKEWGARNRGSAYVQEHIDLQEAIRNGSDYNEGDYGAMSTMTAILGRMACYSGQELTMQDALQHGRQLFPYDRDLTMDSEPPVTPDENNVYEVPTPGVTDVLDVSESADENG